MVERRPESLACMDNIRTYIQSSFFGGYSKKLLALCEELGVWIERDLMKGIVATWFDESYLNKYSADNDVTYLTSDYAVPVFRCKDTPEIVSYLDNPNKHSAKILHSNYHISGGTIPVVISFDRQYIPYAKVVVNSILSKASSGVKLYCFALDLQDNDLDYFRELMSKHNGEFEVVHFDSNALNQFQKFHYLTKATYLRIFIPKFVKESKVLYVDCDTLFLDDVAKLYAESFDGHAIIAAPDWSFERAEPGTFSSLPKLDLPKDETYVNCGIIVLNNEYLRNIDFIKIGRAHV